MQAVFFIRYIRGRRPKYFCLTMAKHCVILFVLCFTLQNTEAQISPEGLVLYLPLNGNTRDYSGNNYNAVNYGATSTTGFNGQPNTAYYFNGRNALVVSNIKKIDGQLKAFSILVRYQPAIDRGGSADYNFFSWQRHGADPEESFRDGKLRIGWLPLAFRPNFDYLAYTANWCVDNNGTFNGYEIDTGSTNNQWQTMAIVYDQGTIKTYFDCTLMRTWPNEFPPFSDLCGSDPMEILLGSVLPGTGADQRNFVGKIDEVRMYTRALTNDEVLYFADSICVGIKPPQPYLTYKINPCQPNQLSFNDSSTVNITTVIDKYVWKVNDTDSGVGQNFMYTFNHTGDYTVRLSLYTGGLAYSRDTVIHISSVTGPKFLKASQSKLFTCVGSPTILNVSGGVAYTWQPCTNLSDCHAASPTLKTDADIDYMVVANDSSNTCKDTVHIAVKVVTNDNNVYVPTAFTPNGDGNNDTWGILSTNPLADFSIQVYNRWGMNVFASQNQGIKWNGTIKNAPAPPGTYIWALNYKNGTGCAQKNTKGTVVLLR